MADINLITFDSSTVTPQHDALMANAELTGNGILYGCGVSKTNDTTLSIAHGVGVIYGREFEINAHTITIEKSGSGTLNGQLFIRMNLGAINPISIVHEEVSGALTALVDNPECNLNNTKTEIQLCTYTVDGNGVVNDSVVNTMPQLTPIGDALAAIRGDVTAADAALSNLSGKTLVHTVTSATANLNGNAYKTQGLYFLTTNTTISNGPSGVVDGFLLVYAADRCVKQIFMRFGTVANNSAVSNDHEVYVRTHNTNTGYWSSWVKLSSFSKTQSVTIQLNSGWSRSSGGVYYKQAAPSGFTEISSVSIYNFSMCHKAVVPYIDYSNLQVGVMCETNSGWNNDAFVTLRVVGR